MVLNVHNLRSILASIFLIVGVGSNSYGNATLCGESLKEKEFNPNQRVLTMEVDDSTDVLGFSSDLVEVLKSESIDLALLKINLKAISKMDFGYKENLLLNQLTLDLASLGYRIQNGRIESSLLQRLYTGLKGITKGEREYTITKDLPSYAVVHAQLMLEFLKTDSCCQNITASKREDYSYSSNPKYKKLTSSELKKIKPGVYSFVYLSNESFLRLGFGHHYIGERRDALSAGDINIKFNEMTGENEIDYINVRSDTYRPLPSALIAGLLGIWRQGIYPRNIKLYNWNNTPSAIGIE